MILIQILYIWNAKQDFMVFQLKTYISPNFQKVCFYFGVIICLILSSCNLAREGNQLSFQFQKLQSQQSLFVNNADTISVSASISNDPNILINPPITPDTCDLITLYKNDKKLKVKNIQPKNNEFWFKYCDSTNDETYAVYKSEVKEIRYANGSNEISEIQYPLKDKAGNLESLGVIAGLMAALGLAIILFTSLISGDPEGLVLVALPFSILAIFFGWFSEIRINENKNYYFGKGLSIAAWVIGVLQLLLLFYLFARLV